MRKVLVIAYYWPPAGGPGVQRWLKFVKYLPDYGIQPVVYVPANAAYPIIDQELLKQLPEGITVISQPIKEPIHFLGGLFKRKLRTMRAGIIPNRSSQALWQRVFLWIRGNLLVPDSRVYWVKPSVVFLTRYIKTHQIDTVITTGPPHSIHLIGNQLKDALGIKWLADFRDPWTSIGYHQKLNLTTWARQRHETLEAKVLQSSDHIIVTSKSTRDEFAKKTKTPIAIITNGYDIEKAANVVLDNKFTLAHIGSLLSGRNPLVLWQVLAELLDEDPAFKNSFQLQLAGTVSQEVMQAIKNYRLDSYCIVHGYVSHDRAVAMQQKSQVLLLIEINTPETKCILPGKLFEYMISGRPVLGIGPAGADMADVMKETNMGVFANYTDHVLVKATLKKWFSAYQEGHLKANTIHTAQYSRQRLTAELANLIKLHWE